MHAKVILQLKKKKKQKIKNKNMAGKDSKQDHYPAEFGCNAWDSNLQPFTLKVSNKWFELT